MTDTDNPGHSEDLAIMVEEQNKVIEQMKAEIATLKHENASLMLKVSVEDVKPTGNPEDNADTFEKLVQDAIDKAMS